MIAPSLNQPYIASLASIRKQIDEPFKKKRRFTMANSKNPHGTFCWNELMTRDTDRASKFYSELIGWKADVTDMSSTPYTVFKAGDKQVAGMMDMPKELPPEVPSHWMAYIAVDDIDALAAKVEKLGGKLMHGPQDVPEVGRFCIIQDPTGAVISLIKMNE
jgi:predicted enzyme related to lactoylglutathione lyase